MPKPNALFKIIAPSTVYTGDGYITADPEGYPLRGGKHSKVVFFIKCTGYAGGGSVALILQARDPASGDWVDIETIATLTTTGSAQFTFPTNKALGTSNTFLPARYRIFHDFTTASSATFSIGAQMML